MDSDDEAGFFEDVVPPVPSMLILTWNIWFTGLPASHAVRMQAIRECITQLLPDVIMLQVRLALGQPLLYV
jgi:endonuclease/exonuclease/phosphatase family metal-dependent hydrolase